MMVVMVLNGGMIIIVVEMFTLGRVKGITRKRRPRGVLWWWWCYGLQVAAQDGEERREL